MSAVFACESVCWSPKEVTFCGCYCIAAKRQHSLFHIFQSPLHVLNDNSGIYFLHENEEEIWQWLQHLCTTKVQGHAVTLYIEKTSSLSSYFLKARLQILPCQNGACPKFLFSDDNKTNVGFSAKSYISVQVKRRNMKRTRQDVSEMQKKRQTKIKIQN